MKLDSLADEVPGARITFAFAAVGIFLLTHWPQLTIPLPGRPDLVAHLGVFGTWTVLFTACGFFASWHSPLNLGLSVLASMVYSGIDEALQLVPFIRRHAAWDDLAANLLGVACGAIFMVAMACLYRRYSRNRV